MPQMSNKRVIFKTKITKILDHTELIREIFVEVLPPHEFQFRAGQFAMLHIPHAEKPVLRAYSVSSDDRETKKFSLIFKKVPGGTASTYIWNSLVGDLLDFTGPFGRVFFPEPPCQQLIFFNTGSGVAQHLSYLRSFADKYPDLNCKMYFGLYTEKEIYYQKELLDLQKKLKNFEFHFVLSEPSLEWKGRKGYVQDFLNEFDYQKIETRFFLCGNGAMIRDTRKILLERDLFDANKIHCEAFH